MMKTWQMLSLMVLLFFLDSKRLKDALRTLGNKVNSLVAALNSSWPSMEKYLTDTTRSGRDARELELTKEVVVLGASKLTLKDLLCRR
jgi:hypothetical protein